jgi:hypothetical protein
MPLNPQIRTAVRRTQSQVPPFLHGVGLALTGQRTEIDAQDLDHVDEQHGALIDHFRGEPDRRDALLEQLRAALGPDQEATLRAFDEGWSEQAIAREEAAYILGAMIGQTRIVCVDCEDDRRRAVAAARK